MGKIWADYYENIPILHIALKEENALGITCTTKILNLDQITCI